MINFRYRLLFVGTMFFAPMIGMAEVVTVTSTVAHKEIVAPPASDVKQELTAWLQAIQVAETDQAAIFGKWPNDAESAAALDGEPLFHRLAESLRAGSPSVSQFFEQCDHLAWIETPFGKKVVLPTLPLHAHVGPSKDTNKPHYITHMVSFYLVLRLVQSRLYDEAQTILAELKTEDAVDPATYLITQAIVSTQLLKTDDATNTLKQFRQFAAKHTTIPRRHLELAKLLDHEIKQMQEKDNPENIARKMNDVRRRLGKGKTDDDTQQSESDVLKDLDELIEKIQKQCQKQGCDGDQGQQANNPAQDSRILKQKGPGNVDRKEFGNDGHWGDLPPKEREEALLKIDKEFPANYRDIIEQFFKEMASDE